MWVERGSGDECMRIWKWKLEGEKSQKGRGKGLPCWGEKQSGQVILNEVRALLRAGNSLVRAFVHNISILKTVDYLLLFGHVI